MNLEENLNSMDLLQKRGVKTYLSSAYSSQESDHRERIRFGLIGALESLEATGVEEKKILALDLLPETEEYSISISHSPAIGGFALAPKPLSLGFDLEAIDRISDEAVQRVSTPGELQIAPKLSYIWSAKEAALKALRESLLVSQVQIETWLEPEDSIYRYTFSEPQGRKGEGLFFSDKDHTIAWALCANFTGKS